METLIARTIEWGMSSRPLPGQGSSGDGYVIRSFLQGWLAAVVDGLGHGEEAAAAAKVGVSTLEKHSGESVVHLLRRCDRSLSATRGAAIGIASFRLADSSMTWLGVGNVAGMLLRADARATPRVETLLLRSGVVGLRMPPLRDAVVYLSPGDTLVLATDGIRPGFEQGIVPSDPPQRTADRVLESHAKDTDDALVLVVRYRRIGE